jgi:hypothetical protein
VSRGARMHRRVLLRLRVGVGAPRDASGTPRGKHRQLGRAGTGSRLGCVLACSDSLQSRARRY